MSNPPTAVTMMATSRPAAEFVKLAALSLGVAAALAVVGWLPTTRVAGADAWSAMLAGIGVSLTASFVGAIPLCTVGRKPPRERHTATMAAMALRMFVTLGLFAAAAFGTGVSRMPLGLWTGISYLCFVAVETYGAVRLIRSGDA